MKEFFFFDFIDELGFISHPLFAQGVSLCRKAANGPDSALTVHRDRISRDRYSTSYLYEF